MRSAGRPSGSPKSTASRLQPFWADGAEGYGRIATPLKNGRLAGDAKAYVTDAALREPAESRAAMTAIRRILAAGG